MIDFCPLVGGGSSCRLHFFPCLGRGLLCCWELLCCCELPPPVCPMPITAALRGPAEADDVCGLLLAFLFPFFLAGLSVGFLKFSLQHSSLGSWDRSEDLDSAGCTMVLLWRRGAEKWNQLFSSTHQWMILSLTNRHNTYTHTRVSHTHIISTHMHKHPHSFSFSFTAACPFTITLCSRPEPWSSIAKAQSIPTQKS